MGVRCSIRWGARLAGLSEFQSPWVAARPPLQLVHGAELRRRLGDVLPLDPVHFTVYVDLAPTSGYKWGAQRDIARVVGRPFPRGILREAEAGVLIEIRTNQGPHKVRAV